MNFLSIAITLLILVATPGLMYLAFITIVGAIALLRRNRIRERKRTIQNKASSNVVKLAVVIPAHNEEHSITETIRSIQGCNNRGGFQIIVIADNCTDQTSKLARDLGTEVIERNDISCLGKGYALNFAFEKIIDRDYNFFVVVDADTLCEANFLSEIENHCEQGTKALQVCNLIRGEADNPYSKITSIGFYAMNYLRPLARSSLGLSVGLFGNGFVLSKELLQLQPYAVNSITEDYEYHLQLLANGFASKIVLTTSVHSRMPGYSSGASSQRSRWEGGKLALAINYSPSMLRKILSGQTNLIEPALELLLPPLSFFTLNLLSIFILSLLYGSTFGIFFATAGFILLTAHTISAIYCLDRSWKSLVYLLSLPNYVIWKIRQMSEILKFSKDNATWIRTRRK